MLHRSGVKWTQCRCRHPKEKSLSVCGISRYVKPACFRHREGHPPLTKEHNRGGGLVDIAKRGVLSLVGEIPHYKKEHYDDEEEEAEEEDKDVTSLSVR